MSNKIKCTCGHSWNKSSSSKKDMNICHICGKDTTMQMGGFVYPVNYVPQKKNGGWLDAYEDDAPEAQNGIAVSDNTTVKKPIIQNPIGFANDPDVIKYNKVKNDPSWGDPYKFLMNWYSDPETKKRLNTQGAPARPMTETLNQKRYDSYLDWLFASKDKNRKTAETIWKDDYSRSKELSDLLNQGLDTKYDDLRDNTSGFHVSRDSSVALNSSMYPDKEKMYTTAVHELTHATPLDDFYVDYFKKNKPKNPSGSETQYFSENPKEIYPRIQDLRYQMWRDKKIAPGTKITPEMLDGYNNDSSENLRNYYSPEELSKIMNEIAYESNNKKPIRQAQNGIEGTMGGLTDKGFDYNGAWGGTMQMGGSMPGSVGFTYARTKGIPSEGPYAKKTMPSAQNGQEMKFYQEGLDWTPKNISMNGSKTPKAQAGWQEKLAKEAAKLDNPLSTFQLMKKGYSKDEIKTIQNAAAKEQPKVGTPKGKQLSKEEILEKNKANIEARNIERGAETLTNAADYALGLPGRLAQSAYKPGYTAEDAFLNKPSGAGFLEEMIADPSNLASFGLKGLAKGVLKGLGKKAVGKGLLSSVPLTFYKSIDRDPALMQAFYDNLAKVKETISTPAARDAFRRVGEVATRRPGSVDIDPMYAAAITDPDLPVKAIDRFAQSLISTNAAENALTADQLKYLGNVGSVATDFKRIDSSLPLKDRIRFAIDNSKNISPRDILPYFYQQGNLATSDKDELVKLLYDSYGGQPVNNPIAEYTAAADLFGLADTYDQQRYSTLSNDVKHEIRRLTESAEAARPELRIADEYFDPNRSNYNNEEAIHLLSRGYYPGIPTAEERTRNMRNAGKQVIQTVNDIVSNPQNRGKSYVGAHSLSTDSYPLQLGLLGRQQGNVDYFPVHTGSASSIYPGSNTMSGLSAHNSNRRNQLIQAKSMFDKNIGNIQSNSNSFRGTNLAGTKQLQGQMLESGLLNAAIADFNKKVGTNMPSAYFSAYENDILRPNVGITIRKDGGPVKDDMGYWNPENWGEPVEIGSNEITMQGVDQDLVGVSDKGDVKYMKANNPKNYKFKGKKVTEYPVKKNGGWLDKYN